MRSLTSKGSQVKTMVSTKFTKCNIQSGWILAPEGLAKKLHVVSFRGQKVRFFHLVCGHGWVIFFSSTIFFTMHLFFLKNSTHLNINQLRFENRKSSSFPPQPSKGHNYPHLLWSIQYSCLKCKFSISKC